MASEEGAKEIPGQGWGMGTGLVGGEVLCGPRAAVRWGSRGQTPGEVNCSCVGGLRDWNWGYERVSGRRDPQVGSHHVWISESLGLVSVFP